MGREDGERIEGEEEGRGRRERTKGEDEGRGRRERKGEGGRSS